MSGLKHGAPIALSGFLDKEGRRFRGRKTRYFKLKDSALYNHRRKDSMPTWGISLLDSRVFVGARGETIHVQLFDGKRVVLFPHSRHDCERWADGLMKASRRKIGNFYGVTGLIGMGSFAEVRVGFDKGNNRKVAIKVMKKEKRDSELMRSVECEMNFISRAIQHENVVQTYDVFDTRDNLYIVMEYMPGGMLYDVLAEAGHFSEQDAALVFRDLLQGVACLHACDIVHRDIKPENVLCSGKTFPLRVKLADFGLADFVLETQFGDKCTNGAYGTPYFCAPCIVTGKPYTTAVDMWSCGIILYNMLSGRLPFDGPNIKEVLRRVQNGRYDFPDLQWRHISPGAKNLIDGLLQYDPKKRLTAEKALEHPWIVSTTLPTTAIQNDLSLLAKEQRKLRMSSMAIDNVQALLEMDDNEEDTDLQGLRRNFGYESETGRSAGSRSVSTGFTLPKIISVKDIVRRKLRLANGQDEPERDNVLKMSANPDASDGD